MTNDQALQNQAAASVPPAVDLDDSANYLSRELSWLQFNRRVLEQAADSELPPLERLKFLAIAGSNLDEFFMKRIGGLLQQIGAGITEAGIDGRTPEEQIADCYDSIDDYQKRKSQVMHELFAGLAAAGIELLNHDQLSASEQEQVRQHYYDNIFPLVTPQAIDPAHPFPFISNLSLNLLVSLRYPGDTEVSLARVKAPVSNEIPRLVRLGESCRFVFLEEVMAANLDLLFPGMKILGCELFRITRNANTESYEEEADDLMAEIESALRNRKFAPIVRMQVRPGIDPLIRGRLAAELNLQEQRDVFAVDGMMGLRDLWQIVQLPLPGLQLPAHHPVDHPQLPAERNIFHIIRETGAILLQHPYEAFGTSVERFLREAADDPKVRAIKMTLYRTSPESRIVDYLIRAAHNGKQVAVAVELKARFDEEANIRLANRMEEAGIHVSYGVMGLKTHAKIILVVRQDYKGLRRYVHLGTGNYHPDTARLYSDLGLLLYDKEIGRDATELFNYLTTGFTPKRQYRRLVVAPKMLKKFLIEGIEKEIDRQQTGGEGRLRFKMNALEDPEICTALYRAATAGVRVDLMVRDTCRIRPLLPNLRIISLIGRFLEHSRVYQFGPEEEMRLFIGSADAMRRNLEHRVELLAPVESQANRDELNGILDLLWQDSANSWQLLPDGSYARRPTKGDQPLSAQAELILRAEKRLREATRLKKRKATVARKRN